MCKTVYDLIQSNIEVVKEQVKAGIVSTTIISKYEMYNYYLSLNGKKMDRYQFTADTFKSCDATVRNVVKYMETEI